MSAAHSCNVGREVSVALACNVETAYYLIFINVLINCCVSTISYIASNFNAVVENYNGKGVK